MRLATRSTLVLLVASTCLAAPGASPPAAETASTPGCPAVLDHTFNSLQTGRSESLCEFRGKVVLIVNTASYCGYTHQYEGLEAMYRKYKDRGLVIVGFPSNDFGDQEPGTNHEIAEFCRLTYGVEFPMFEKSSVKSIKANPFVRATHRSHGADAAVELSQIPYRARRHRDHQLRFARRARQPRVGHSGGAVYRGETAAGERLKSRSCRPAAHSRTASQAWHLHPSRSIRTGRLRAPSFLLRSRRERAPTRRSRRLYAT